MAASSSESGATPSSVSSGESGALKPESSPAPVPESMRLNGPNFLKWQRFVETIYPWLVRNSLSHPGIL